jgi:hypothetical protein
MKPTQFISTLYLGDRVCKAIIVDGWNSCVRIQVDCISRIRDVSGNWNYYTDEDIIDGFIVFNNVRTVTLDNAGHLPNDSINSLVVVDEIGDTVSIEISISSVDVSAAYYDTTLRLTCQSIHIEHPGRPGEEIST